MQLPDSFPPPLRAFVDAVTALHDATTASTSLCRASAPHLKTLVSNDQWLAEAYTKPHPEYYQQYLLYCDPEKRFSVVSFVWGPGQTTPIHDHQTWGVVGMLRGSECSQNYVMVNGKPQASEAEKTLLPGDIELIEDGALLHRVRNALNDQVSISVHLYGGNIGEIKRHTVNPESGEFKPFISGYSNQAGC